MLEITPLGTVSTFCYEDKCCPGFLVKHNNQNVLLDCGNGITKHMNFPNDLNNLTIFISHLHPDHYGELLSIAQTSLVFNRLGYLTQKIKVYIPEGDIRKVSEDYKDEDGWSASRLVEKPLIDFDYLMNLEKHGFIEFITYKENDKINMDDMEISFKRNPHQIITYSTKIQTSENTIVYSSDTGFKNNTLENFSKDANLLICESTFLRGQMRLEDYHLYAHEAGKIAASANVEKLLLTHFWPMIPKEQYVEEAKEFFENTEPAIEGKKLILRR